jgi:hypothetical protein
MTEITCPICKGGVLRRGEGKLDQSGDSYLPTVVWSCAICEFKHYEPATRARWCTEAEAEAAPAPEAAPVHRRAA